MLSAQDTANSGCLELGRYGPLAVDGEPEFAVHSALRSQHARGAEQTSSSPVYPKPGGSSIDTGDDKPHQVCLSVGLTVEDGRLGIDTGGRPRYGPPAPGSHREAGE
jgi:hypothetical protein